MTTPEANTEKNNSQLPEMAFQRTTTFRQPMTTKNGQKSSVSSAAKSLSKSQISPEKRAIKSVNFKANSDGGTTSKNSPRSMCSRRKSRFSSNQYKSRQAEKRTPSPTPSEKVRIAEEERQTKIITDARAKVRLDLANKFRVSNPAGASENLTLRQTTHVFNRSRRVPQINQAQL